MSIELVADSLGQFSGLSAGAQLQSQQKSAPANPPTQKPEKWPAIIPTAEIRPAPPGTANTPATSRLNSFA